MLGVGGRFYSWEGGGLWVCECRDEVSEVEDGFFELLDSIEVVRVCGCGGI